ALDPQIIVEELQILRRIAITPAVEANGFGYISMARMKNSVDFINKNIEVSGDKLTAEQIYRAGYLPEVPIKPYPSNRPGGRSPDGAKRHPGFPHFAFAQCGLRRFPACATVL